MDGYVRAYEGNDPYLFVSYAHRDSEKVLPIIRELYGQKYRAWYDEGIAPGSEWPQNIARHLQKSSAVVVFASEYYFLSPNCKNEARVALENKKEIISVCLDDAARHLLLGDSCDGEELSNADAALLDELRRNDVLELDDDLIGKLTSRIGGAYLGDGICGYEYSIDKTKSFNVWNLMLGLAGVLAVVFVVALYGLYNGWFDALLPAKQPVVEVAAPTTQPQKEVVSVSGGNIIGSVLPVEFSSEEEKNAVYQKLGWTQPYEMTYEDLVGMKGLTHLEICSEPISDISFAAYLPDLELITLSDAPIVDLSPLAECPKLKTVQVTADMLPLVLPTVQSFVLEVI